MNLSLNAYGSLVSGVYQLFWVIFWLTTVVKALTLTLAYKSTSSFEDIFLVLEVDLYVAIFGS